MSAMTQTNRSNKAGYVTGSRDRVEGMDLKHKIEVYFM